MSDKLKEYALSLLGYILKGLLFVYAWYDGYKNYKAKVERESLEETNRALQNNAAISKEVAQMSREEMIEYARKNGDLHR